METPLCTAVFWRGGEKIDLNGLKPDAVQRLSVTGERKVDLSFLRDYPNLEELTLTEKCEGAEVLSELKQLHTLSLWLSAPVSWDDVSLPGLRVLHLRGEKNGDITPASLQHYLSPSGGNAKNRRSRTFPDCGAPASKALSPVAPCCAGSSRTGWAFCSLCPETL